uniref:C-type lectin domain-containing protein n=1 Tax=Sinocyclocheilus grahami TaxID=75366 RepID=A0A672M0F0_SINGR
MQYFCHNFKLNRTFLTGCREGLSVLLLVRVYLTVVSYQMKSCKSAEVALGAALNRGIYSHRDAQNMKTYYIVSKLEITISRQNNKNKVTGTNKASQLETLRSKNNKRTVFSCQDSCHKLCVNHKISYILYKQLKTWENAQNYCRTHHYDLATVQTDEDWTSLKEAADEQQFYGFAWVGLFNDIKSWRWSYNEESLVFESWGLVQPDNYGYGQECAAIDGTGHDFCCSDLRCFVCYDHV